MKKANIPCMVVFCYFSARKTGLFHAFRFYPLPLKRFLILHSAKLTWLAGKWTLWRCISYWTWVFHCYVSLLEGTSWPVNSPFGPCSLSGKFVTPGNWTGGKWSMNWLYNLLYTPQQKLTWQGNKNKHLKLNLAKYWWFGEGKNRCGRQEA